MGTPIAVRHQLVRIGERIANIRLARNLTQTELGNLAGSSRSTIRRLENGESVSLETFVRVLGALGLSTDFNVVLPDPSVRPVERVRLQGQERQRARSDSPAPQKASDWAWGEEIEE